MVRELHQQLQELAHEMGLHLLLMGNGAALRMDLSSLRGSADNDYLTSASPRDVQALLDALARRFSGMPDGTAAAAAHPQARGRRRAAAARLQGRRTQAFDPNPTIDALTVKLEFHLRRRAAAVRHDHRRSRRRRSVPDGTRPAASLPGGAQLLTLVAPPVGIDADREPAIARQIYDIDVLLAAMQQPADGTRSAPTHPTGTPRRSPSGTCHPPRLSPGPARVGACRSGQRASTGNTWFWHHINAMQSSQMARSSQRTPEEWAARCHRLIVATHCLRDAKPHEPWQRALSIEALIPPKPHGPELRALRRALRRVAKAPVGHPRAGFWAALAQAEDSRDLLARLDALDRTLADI